MENWEDDRLIAGLKEKNETAFRMLIRQYQPKLFRIACAITFDREDSADIVQEVFIKVFENIHSFKQESRLSYWLKQITIHHCFNWKRKWKRRFKWAHQPIEGDKEEVYPEIGTDEQSPDVLFQEKETEKIVWDCLKRLPEDARAIFMLREIEGLSYDEIAETLKIPRGTVNSRLFYARKRLQTMLTNKGKF